MAFITPSEHYEYLRIIEGSINKMLACMNSEVMFRIIKAIGLKLNLAKCSFLKTHIDYLEHELSASDIQLGGRKIRAVQVFSVPLDVHGVRRFSSLVSY